MNPRFAAIALLPLFAASVAFAQQEAPAPTTIAPPPTFGKQPGFYTTHDAPANAPTALPWMKQQQESLQSPQSPSPFAAPAAPAAAGKPDYMPFQRAAPNVSQPVPEGPQMMRSVPVENIDGIEVTEPAAPADTTLEANPVAEDPATPSEINSPIFSADVDSKTPRTIVLRVLNKVTARAEQLTTSPGETVNFGKLAIETVNCYRSSPRSQPDSVALLSIREHVADQQAPKLLFHGWMYASSPSITALEHPVYDVTMVECKLKGADKEEAKDAVAPDEKKADKPKR